MILEKKINDIKLGFWTNVEVAPLMLKVIEWAQKHGKKAEILTREEIEEAIKYK